MGVARVRRPGGSQLNLSSQFAVRVLLGISIIFRVTWSLPLLGFFGEISLSFVTLAII